MTEPTGVDNLQTGYMITSENSSCFVAIDNPNMKIYYPNYYYYLENGKYKLEKSEQLIDSLETSSDDGKLYPINFVPTEQLYLPKKFYVQDAQGLLTGTDSNKYSLSLDNYNSQTQYYIRKKFVVLKDTSGRFPIGYEWAPMARIVPPQITLGILTPKYALIELDGLENGESSILGTALRMNKLLGTKDNLDRNVQTITGVINKGRDLLGQWDTLEAGKILGLNDFGQICSTDADIEGLKTAFRVIAEDPSTETTITNLVNTFNWSNDINRNRLKVLVQELVNDEQPNHLADSDGTSNDIDLNYYYGRIIFLLLGENFEALRLLLANGKNLFVKLATFLNLITIDSLNGLPENAQHKYNDDISVTLES